MRVAGRFCGGHISSVPYSSGLRTEKDSPPVVCSFAEVDGTCNTYGGDGEFVQHFCGET